ncbi:hypothetical protein ACHAXA_003171 [Cyclostephanos tholiformis]|uniref:NOT2/NOT3/NOT5 C-terminal domain-containing protein n=1 Tax=Cyclostephanos tholiformis TaxID=382380 RepID=A0ABD3STA0_9STRA
MLQMDGATTTSTGSNNSAAGVNNSNVASSFLNLGNLGSNQAVVGGMGLFSSVGGGGEGLGSSFGTSFGNGFTNDSGSANPSFDLNDFPSLGGGAASGAGSTVSAGSDNGLAAALRQQQQLLQQQVMQGGISAADKSSNLYRLAMSSGIANGTNNNFNMTTEDFPALGASGDAGGQTEGGSTLDTASLTTGSVGILDSGGINQLDYTGLIGSTGVTLSSGIQQGSQPRSTSAGTQSGIGGLSSAAVGSSGNSGSGGAIGGDYGLLGLLSVIRMTDADRNRLALGSDLTVLGLNLNSPDVLHSTFGGPFADKPATKDPHYQLPMCYYMQPPALKTGHLSKFQLETLFYIFYALPKDVLQAYAAQELYTREWRYHAESKLWFKRATPSETGLVSGNGLSSGGQFIYFDINTWERRMYGNVNQNIAGGFLPEDEVRVKFPSS